MSAEPIATATIAATIVIQSRVFIGMSPVVSLF
jgi:hypothetical protein